MHIAGKGIWHHTKTFAMEQEILMELYSMSSSLLRKISAGALMHIVNIIIYGKLQTSVRIQMNCIYESISTFSTLIFTSTWTATWIMNSCRYKRHEKSWLHNFLHQTKCWHTDWLMGTAITKSSMGSYKINSILLKQN